MTHSHADDRQTYYLDQLCTIGICGGLGAIMILLYGTGALEIILHPKFHLAVLYGGFALLFLVAIRAVAVWLGSLSRAAECHHGHDEPYAYSGCAHSRGGESEHSHGWAPWRYAVLLLPVVLYFLNIPSRAAEEPPEPDGIPTVAFSEVERSADNPETRAYWEQRYQQGEKTRFKGLLVPTRSDNEIRLARYKRECCWADAVPVAMPVSFICKEPLPARELNNQWVSLLGMIKFVKSPDRDEWFPSVEIETAADVKKMQRADPNPLYN